MAKGDVKLFGVWSRPFSLRIILALKLKGIEFEYIEEDLSNKSSQLLEYNPIHKKIPVLVHNGKPIVESLVILEYIDEIWKDNPILPVDPYERATARFLAKLGDEKCLEAVWRVFIADGKEQEEAIPPAIESLKPLEEALDGKKFFDGATIGFTDISLSSMVNMVRVFEEIINTRIINEAKFPFLSAWIENYLHFPIIQNNLPRHDKMVEKFRSRRLSYVKRV
ncbi:glutathione transferase GST 23-like [Magnolia sinica]|uniref:glutathione transferase GST 23-like n=1 Tax=Magnolia sinica TaxID=86752 RepID=UPI002659B375|nr:glutathione transferase GST 23-like [Magnolia sinica]